MIVAKASEGATKEQVNLMWQNLLKDRFGVVNRGCFTVEFDVNQPPTPGDGNGAYTIASALEQDCGLKLVKGTFRLDVIVVDHAEKTTVEN